MPQHPFWRALLAPLFLSLSVAPISARAQSAATVVKAPQRAGALPAVSPFRAARAAQPSAPPMPQTLTVTSVASPSRETPRHVASSPPKHHPRKKSAEVGGSLHAIRNANAGSLSAPASGAFVNATLFYNYELGQLYRIDASPRFLTTIALRPGEKLVSKAAGDTVRWVLGETVQGTGDSAQVLVFVKPVQGGQRTNIVLTTDQRTYHLEAVSHEQPLYTSVISWNYPLEQAREAQAAAARLAERKASVVEAAVPVDNLNFAYKVEHPHQRQGPRWEPARVFDDGSKTYIQFPADIGRAEAPPLFLIGPKNEAELVNYRVRGSYYVVDRLIDVAELRLGEKPQAIVRITRKGRPG